MTPTDHAPEFPLDGVVADEDGFAIGKVGEIYTDNDTGQPRWVIDSPSPAAPDGATG